MHQDNFSIADLQLSLQHELSNRKLSILSGDSSSKTASYLCPDGFRIVCTLRHDNGRKIKENAAASNWDPSTDQIVITYERIPKKPDVSYVKPVMPVLRPPLLSPTLVSPAVTAASSNSKVVSDVVTALDVQQCCDALAAVEKAGKPFIALKWFRDLALPGYGFAWTKSPELRHKVLAKAIESGEIETYKTHNPQKPDFPTTAVRLRHFAIPPAALSRFKPIPAGR